MIDSNKLKKLATRIVNLSGDYDSADEGLEDSVIAQVQSIISGFCKKQQKRIAELEAAEALNSHLDLAVRKAEGVSEALRRRAEAAEAELSRRDAAAGDPFAYHYHYAGVETCEGFQDWRHEFSRDRPPEWMVETGKIKDVNELFTAAQPSALPPEEPPEGLGPKGRSSSACQARGAFISGWKAHHDAAKALGCKAIKLPTKKMQNIFSGVAVAYRVPCKDAERRDNEWVEAIKAQGFTVEGD